MAQLPPWITLGIVPGMPVVAMLLAARGASYACLGVRVCEAVSHARVSVVLRSEGQPPGWSGSSVLGALELTRAAAAADRTIVLVEGISDQLALTALAEPGAADGRHQTVPPPDA